MTDRIKWRISALYPECACGSAADHQIIAAHAARLPALGPGTGGDGSVADLLRAQLLWPLACTTACKHALTRIMACE